MSASRLRRVFSLAVAFAALAASAGCGLGAEERRDEPAQRPTTPERVPEPPPADRAAADLDGDLDAVAIYRRLSPGVVTVLSRFGRSALLGGGDGLGAGFVLDQEGRIATNAHVVTSGRPPDIDRAKEVFVEFADGNRVPARIRGHDPNADVALLEIETRGLSLRPLPLGSSTELTVGEPVAAIGSPYGEQQSLSVGVISALDRDIESLTGFAIGNAIQTDAAINRGNSGGPLLDARGRVIGINSQIKSTSGGGEGVGFAVPVETVRRSIEQLGTRGRVAYAFLGVSSANLYPQLARHLGLPAERGALVQRVEPGSPAQKAGIRAGRDTTSFQGSEDVPRGGDVILAVDGRPLSEPNDLTNAIVVKNPGEAVRLEVLRGRERRTVTVRLAERPASAPKD